MKTIVISQPMFFPWVGMLEQMRLADVFVWYDDVQHARNSFCRRVQIKTAAGRSWLTVPLADAHQRQRIDEIRLCDVSQWATRHENLLRAAYGSAPFFAEMLALVHGVYATTLTNLADLAIASMQALRSYFDIAPDVEFVRSSALEVAGQGSERILRIVQALGGDAYVSGHGGLNYLEHERFEHAGIEVRYMDYRCIPYPQLHGAFTPYVSALDLVANAGRAGAPVIASPSVPWRAFSAHRALASS